MAKLPTPFVISFPEELSVTFEGEELVFGGLTARNRPAGHPPGSSSPQWVEKIVVGTSREVALKAAEALRVGDDGDPSCTGTSKEATLVIAREGGEPETIEGVYMMVTDGEYAFLGAKPHTAKTAKISRKPFDPTPGEPAQGKDAVAWRVMSEFCEALFRGFGPGANPDSY